MKNPIQDIILYIGLLLACMFLTSIIYSFIELKFNSSLQEHDLYLIAGILTQMFGFIGSIVLFLVITKQKLNSIIHLSKIKINTLLVLMLVTVLCFFVSAGLGFFNELLSELIPNHPWVISNQELSENQILIISQYQGILTLLPIVVVAILPAIAEEVVFRGFLYTKLHEISQNKNLAILSSALIFAVIHFQILSFLPMLFMGIVLGIVYMKSNNIVYPIIIHFLFNATQIILIN